MSDARPRLEVVPGGAGQRDEAGASVDAEPARGRRWAVWLLLAALAAALVGLAVESRRADALGREVAALEAAVADLSGEVAASEAALEAHRSHLESVRGLVAELSALVDRDPAPAP